MITDKSRVHVVVFDLFKLSYYFLEMPYWRKWALSCPRREKLARRFAELCSRLDFTLMKFVSLNAKMYTFYKIFVG